MNILVLEKYADDYRAPLRAVTDHITFAHSLTDTAPHYDILLAQPDLAAAYLQSGGTAHWIQSTWAGVRPLADVVADASVVVTGIKDIFGGQIAEYVFTYLLEEIRQPKCVREAQQNRLWQPELPDTAAGRHMLIVGTGSIGRALAGVARAFGLRVTGVSRSGNPVEGFEHVRPATQLPDAVQDADYVVAVIPDTNAAHHLFDATVFASMRNAPLFFNVGRGASVNPNALLHALHNGLVRGAVLDVFETEPLPNDSPLWDAPGVTITPHIAAVSHPDAIAQVFLDNLARYREGRPLLHVVELTRGY